MTLPTLDEIEAAAAVVYRHMPPTPQYRWPLLDIAAITEVWVKMSRCRSLAFGEQQLDRFKKGIAQLDRGEGIPGEEVMQDLNRWTAERASR